MENQTTKSVPIHPNQRLGSPGHELQSISSSKQTQKRNCLDSPQPDIYVSVQSFKRSRNTNSANRSPQLFPEEIIIEILSNLPVKSLLRFRCVSKSWKGFTAAPFFIEKHLRRNKFSRKQLLIKTEIESQTEPQYRVKSCFLTSVFKDPIVCSTEIEYPSDKVPRHVLIVGSCNGLICIANRDDTIFLLNPILGVFKKLTNPNPRLLRSLGDLGLGRIIYGFGFDASKDDYKVVRAVCYQSNGFEDNYKSILRVYSLRTNRWRSIRDFPFGVPCNDDVGKFVNGCLNWLVFHMEYTIVSFDLAQETFKELLQPSFGEGVSDETTLGVLDGSLCVICNYGRLYAELWVMKEYGKRESWSKLVTIPYMQIPGYDLFSTPLFVSESGEILLRFGSNLIIYNPKEKLFMNPVIPHDAIYYIQQVEVYEESLVSPTSFDQNS